MTNEIGFKELYEVSLKATLPIEVGGETIEAGEVVAFFDSIQLANFQEIKNTASSKGGFDNRSYIYWESTREVKVNFTQGVFSKTQLALMTNAKLINNKGTEIVVVSCRETLETNEDGVISLKNEPVGNIFIYDLETGKKMQNWLVSGNQIKMDIPFKTIIVDYSYSYNNQHTVLQIGKALTCGYFSLVGKIRVKDGVTGKVTTGIIKIPKLRLMSDLSMRVGSDAIPQVGKLEAIAVPEGARGQSKVMEIIFLNDDIDADM